MYWPRAAGGLLVICMLSVAGGCGYTHKPLYSQDIRAVAVPVAENQSFYRGIEFDLTEAVIKEIELRTPYKVMDSARADTMIRMTVTAVQQSLLSREPRAGLPQEIEVTLTADFDWRDLHSGKILRQRKGFQSVGRYIPTRGIGEPFEVAQHQAVQRLAGEIVSIMAEDW